MKLEPFISYMHSRGYAAGTITSYTCELQQFRQFLRDQRLRLNQVQPLAIERYLRWRDPGATSAPSSTRRRLAVLSSFFDFVAVMSNGRIRNPTLPLRRPRRQPPRPSPLDDAAIEKMRSGLKTPRDRAIFALLLNSGLRVSELCSLDRDSIRVEHPASGEGGRVIGVGRVVGKGNREREFLADLETLRLIHEYLAARGEDGNPALFLSSQTQRINKRTVQHLVRAWSRASGLPPVHPHQLRATFATRLGAVGVPALEVSQLLGHRQIDTTLAYLKPDMRRIRAEFFAAHELLNR